MEKLAFEHDALKEGEAMLRLLNNADFNKIFVKGFLEESLVQLGYNFASSVNMRNSIAEQIIARKHVKDYIDIIISTASSAKDAIELAQYNFEQGENNE